MQTLHRVRDRLVHERTSLMNQIRSLLLERGHIVPQGRAKLAVRLNELLDTEEQILRPRNRILIADMRERWEALDRRIASLDTEFVEHARSDDRARRLLTIPGIGALNATALVAAVGDANTFGRGLAPGAADPQHMEHTIEKTAIIARWPRPATTLRRQQRPDQFPFRVRQIPATYDCSPKSSLGSEAVQSTIRT